MLAMVILMGFATSKIAQVEKKWGPPNKVEKLNGNSIYYGYFYKDRENTSENRVI